MRTIAFVTQKGGSGKSTIASSLAVAAQEMKEKVCVIDMDPQGSFMNWLKTRAADDIEVVASGAARLPALLAPLKAKASRSRSSTRPAPKVRRRRRRCRSPISTSSRPGRACSISGRAPEPAPRSRRSAPNSCSCSTSARPRSRPRAFRTASRRSRRWADCSRPLILARVDYQEAARHGCGVTELDPTAPRQRKCAAFGSRSSAAWRAAKSGTAREAA